MRRATGLAALLALGACTGPASVTTVERTTTLPPPTATSTTAPATTAAISTSTTTTALLPECPPPVGGITGDFDGDGAADAAYIRDLVLVSCLADGTVSSLDVGGMGEVLEAVDLQGDGVDEILAGGTTAWGRGADVAVIAGGELAAVTIDGERLQLWRGIPAGGVLEYGCADEDGDGRREVILVEGEITGEQVEARRRVVTIDGDTATELEQTPAILPLTGSTDLLSEPAVRELAGGAC